LFGGGAVGQNLPHWPILQKKIFQKALIGLTCVEEQKWGFGSWSLTFFTILLHLSLLELGFD
jgi:hypothetical protein